MAALPFVFSCFFLFLQRGFDLGRFFVLHFLYFLFDRVTESHPPALSEVIACPGSHTFFAFISEQHHFFFFCWLGVILGWLSFSLFKTVQISRYPPVRFCVSWHFLVYLLSWSLFFLGSQ